MAKPTVYIAVAGYCSGFAGGAPAVVKCADVAKDLVEVLGYEPSLPAVSRALRELGWRKTLINSKVHFERDAVHA